MRKNNQSAVKTTGSKKINTKWLNNVMKSIGSTTMDSFKTLAPNISSAGEGVASSIRDLRTMTSGNSIGSTAHSLSNNKYIQYGKKAFDNIIDDLKTGNLNNTERQNKAMEGAMGFEDFSFGDENDGASITYNYIDEGDSDNSASIEIANSIRKSGEATVKAQKATVDAMISVASAGMLQSQEIGKETNAHLGSINNNIAALLAYHQENTTKFYESAMAVFDRFAKKQEEESSGNNKTTKLFNSNGGINPSAYKEYVRKQIKSTMKESSLGGMADMILSDDTVLEMAVSNPIGFASKMIIQGMVPHLVTNTIKGMEDAFTGFMPTMVAKLGEWRTNEEKGLAGNIKRLIGNIFGIDVEKINNINMDNKVDKEAAVFDGMTRNSIVEIIPKHLREMSSYLKDIAAHFNVDTNASKNKSEIFDAKSGKYITIEQLQKNIANSINESVSSAMSSTDFGRGIEKGGNELVGKDSKTYERMVKQMYTFMSRMDGAFTPESFNINEKDSKINQILENIDVNNKNDEKVLNVLKETIKLLGENQKVLHHSQFAALKGIEAKNDKLSELEKDYDIENLISAGITSDTDINEFVDKYSGNKKAQALREAEKKRAKEEEKAKEKKEYKNRRKGSARSLAKRSLQNAGVIERNDTKQGRERISANNADATTVPGFIANTGNHLKDSMFSAMNGDTKGAMASLGAIFTDGMKTLWGSIKDNFLTPLKDSIFGKKNGDGYIDGGLFSGVQNKAKDIWKEIGFHINGKEYTDSLGVKHEANPEDSVVGKVKGIASKLTESIRYRLFGDKDKDGENAEKKGNVVGGIIDTFKTGLLGWKTALFGDDPKKDADEQLKNFKDKAMKAIPDLGVGAIGGLALSQVSGGLLGTIIGGPITGIALGMGTSLLARSNKFKDYLFGEEVEDENGNKSRVGGLISKKTQEMFKDPAMKKSAVGGAALGLAKSFIFGSSGGLLGSLVGGPIAGAMFGAGLGILRKSEMFQNFMYGEMGEDGERSGGFKDKLKAKIKSTFGKDNKDDTEEGKNMKKAFGMSAIGAGAGGVMGLLMGGPIVGSVIGLASGIAASTGKFKKWMFGEKDEDGNKTKMGIVDKLGNWMHTEIMAPMKNKVLDLVEDAKTTIKYDILNVAGILMEPAVDYVKGAVDKVKEKFSEGMDIIKEKLFAPIGRIASAIAKPVKKAVGAVVDFAYKQVKTMVTLPFKIMKTVALAISSPFVKLAGKVKDFLGDIRKKIFGALGFVIKKTFNFATAPLQFLAGATTYLGSKAKDKLAGVGGDVKKKEHIEGDDWRTKLKNNKIDKKNEMAENKKSRRERQNMAYNRSLVAKTLGYDVKYLTEENFEAALAVDKKLEKKMKGPGFGFFGDKSKRQFEEDPAEVAKKQREKIAKASDSDIANMDSKDQDIETRNLIQTTRQTSILERILNLISGKRSKFGDNYDGDDGGDAKTKGLNDATKDKKDKKEKNGTKNESDEGGNEEQEETKHGFEKIADEIRDSGGIWKYIKSKVSSLFGKAKDFFSLDGIDDSDLMKGVYSAQEKYSSLKSIFSKKDRARAKGGDVDKGKAYLVGDGGSDPSAAEILVPEAKGKILSQKNGGIKVTVIGIASKAIESIKKIFSSNRAGQGIQSPVGDLTTGPQIATDGILPTFGKENNSSDAESVARATVNANSEPDYDENGNLIKEKADNDIADDIEDEDEKEDAIVAADNASDLANAKNKGSFLTQQTKKKEAEEANNAVKQLEILSNIKSGQDEGNKDRKSHSNLWASIFSKKGLITMGIMTLLTAFPGLLSSLGGILGGALELLGDLGSSAVSALIDQFKSESQKAQANGGIGKNTNGNSASEEVNETIENIKDGNILDLQADGSASKTSSSIAKVIGRGALNWKNRYFTKGNGKLTKKVKKVMRGAEAVAKAPGRAVKRVIYGKPTEYEKTIRDHKKNKLTYDKKTDRWIDNYNREVLSTDQWDEMVAKNGDEWAAANKDKYFIPDDKTSPKNPKKGFIERKVDDLKDAAKTKVKETKVGKKVTEIKTNVQNKITNSKPAQALENARTGVQNKVDAVKGKVDDAIGGVKGKVDDAIGGVKNKVTSGIDNAKTAVKGKVDDVLKAGAGKADDAIEKGVTNAVKDDGWFKKVCGMVSDFLKSLFEKIGKAAGKNPDDLAKVTSKFGLKTIKEGLSKVWDKTLGKFIGFLTGKIGLASVTFGLSELVGLGLSAIDGATCAAKLFEVSKDDVDGTMTLIATAWGALTGTTVGGLFDLVCSVLEPFLGKIQKFICVSIYKFIKGKDSEDVKALEENQGKFIKQWEADRDAKLKKQYETQIKTGIISKDVTFEQFVAGVQDGTYKAETQSFEDYNTDVNGGMFDKAISAVGGGLTSAWHGLKGVFWEKEKKQDADGNTYTKNKDGTWAVTDKDGNEVGSVTDEALNTKKDLKDVSEKGLLKKAGDAIGKTGDAMKAARDKAVGAVKSGWNFVKNIFTGKSDEEKKAEEEKKKAEEEKKKEEELSHIKYKIAGDKDGKYYKYDAKTKKFLLYTSDGKPVEGQSLTKEQVDQMVKEKKLTAEKEQLAKKLEPSKGIFSRLVDSVKSIGNKISDNGGIIGSAKKAISGVTNKVSDAVKKSPIGQVAHGLKNMFFGKSDEEKKAEEQKKKEEQLSHIKYKITGDKDGKYYKYDAKTKKFLLYTSDGKVVEKQTLTMQQIDQMVKEKKLTVEKEQIMKPKEEKGFFSHITSVLKGAADKISNNGGLLASAKKALPGLVNKAKDLVSKTPIGKFVKGATKLVDRLSMEEVYRNPKDKTYWKYDSKDKVYYNYTITNQKTNEKPKTKEEIEKLFKEGTLIKDKIEKNTLIGKAINKVKSDIKDYGGKLADSYKKITGKKDKAPGKGSKLDKKPGKKLSDKKMLNKKDGDAVTTKKNTLTEMINRQKEQQMYVYYEKKDKSYYACINGSWYHFNKDGQRISDTKISFSFINAKFLNGDLVRDKMNGKALSSEAEAKKYLKSIAKDKNKKKWESNDKKDKDKEKAKKDTDKKEKERKKKNTKKVFMGPDGDYYKKNKDGTYNHYNSFGSLIDENIDGDEKDEIEKKIKNGTFVATEESSKKKPDVNKIHSKINKASDATWKEAKKAADQQTGIQPKPKTTGSTSIMGTIGNWVKGVFGFGGGEEKDEIGGEGGDELNGFKFYSQKDRRWGNKDYSNGKSKSTMAKAGCGPTAMSMVASQLSGKNLSPTDIADDAKRAGFRDKTGTNSNFINYESKKLNLPSMQYENPSADFISSEIDKGHPMILNGITNDSESSPYTTKGHYIVAVGKNDSGDILINDPRGKSKSIPVSPENLARETRLSWSFGRVRGRKNKLTGVKKRGGYGENTFTAEDVINIAKKEVGYSEKKSAKNLNDKKKNAGKRNYTKYAKEVGHANGKAWCATFVVWCFTKAANDDKEKAKEVLCGANTAACASNQSAFKNAKQFDTKPKAGDVVFFMNGSSHTGIVISVDGDIITTIEGNTSPGKFNRDGGCVAQKSYNYKTEKKISGYGHPKYDEESNSNASTADTSSETENNSDATTDVSDGFLSTFQNLASEYVNRIMKGDYNSDFSSVLNKEENSESQDSSKSTDASKTDSSADGSIATDAKDVDLSKLDIKTFQNSDMKTLPKPSQKQILKMLNKNFVSKGNSIFTKKNAEKSAEGIYKAQEETGLTSLVPMSIGALESGWGTSSIAKKKGNLWGWKAYNANPMGGAEEFGTDTYKAFKGYTSDFLKTYYDKYEAHSIHDVGFGTNPAKKGYAYSDGGKISQTWAPNVTSCALRNAKAAGGEGGFGEDEENIGLSNFQRAKDLYNKSYAGSGSFGKSTDRNTTLITRDSSTNTNNLFDLLSGNSSLYDKIFNKKENSNNIKLEQLLEKMVSILESIDKSSNSSIDELKKIAKNGSQMNTTTNVITNSNNNTNGVTQTAGSSRESRNSLLARQLAKG